MVAGNDACVTAGAQAGLSRGNRSVIVSFGYADKMGAPA